MLLRVELLNRINRQDRTGCALHPLGIDYRGAVIGIIVVRPVNNKVVVLGPVAVRTDREKPTAGASLYAGTQHHQILEVATIEGKIVYCLIRERASQRCISSLDCRGLIGY